MYTVIFVLAIYVTLAGLVALARRDRFTGAALVAQTHNVTRRDRTRDRVHRASPQHRTHDASLRGARCAC
jgi:hypothetical protein